ncbi:MAG: hypothetical protein CMI30_00515 [Opitutae bacterium]|nr:hypothetical protein [Rhodospirillaceae bacterium]MBL61867.1 hypothetical protein [Opitutae bacterium]|tara:strand:- start:934 stop:1989 length:1056 start_codon:yes stop_codon:yes gene_type:complete
MKDPFENITNRIRSFIDGGQDDFDDLAQALFALQYEHVIPYRNFCESRSITPGSSKVIPAIPSTAFRDYEVTSLDTDDRSATFHSSGTTTQTPSRNYHNHASLKLYEHSLTTTYSKNLTATPRTLSLTPAPASAPHSSLVHMLRAVQVNPIFTGASTPTGWKVDTATTLKEIQASDAPITIMGTAFSFVHLCDEITPISLPPGSQVMETGGYKGQSRELGMADLHALITEKLGILPSQIVREYGMCELSSQAYATRDGHFRFPHWAKTRIVSPETGREVASGQTGILEVIDLASTRSVLAIRTGDLAIRHSEDFELLGRAASSDPRGCSLNATDLDSSRAREARSPHHGPA